MMNDEILFNILYISMYFWRRNNFNFICLACKNVDEKWCDEKKMRWKLLMARIFFNKKFFFDESQQITFCLYMLVYVFFLYLDINSTIFFIHVIFQLLILKNKHEQIASKICANCSKWIKLYQLTLKKK